MQYIYIYFLTQWIVKVHGRHEMGETFNLFLPLRSFCMHNSILAQDETSLSNISLF